MSRIQCNMMIKGNQKGPAFSWGSNETRYHSISCTSVALLLLLLPFFASRSV
jgi:hypothetical protein